MPLPVTPPKASLAAVNYPVGRSFGSTERISEAANHNPCGSHRCHWLQTTIGYKEQNARNNPRAGLVEEPFSFVTAEICGGIPPRR